MVQSTHMNPARYRRQLWLLSCFLAVCVIGFTQSEIPAASPSNQADDQPLYAPPKKLIPRARVGGDVRGTEGTDPEVKALVPDHVGYTVQETPAVNWFLSQPTVHQVRFTLRDDRSPKAFQEKPIPTPKQPGVQTINLKDLGLVLEPNVQYRWFVSVIRDANSPSKDIVAGGVIERCEISECLEPMGAKLTCTMDTVIDNAKAGFWYDAMGCLCNLIDAEPKNDKLRRMRARLLKDVGLNGVAEWDLKAIPVSAR
ncbi:MAG TPA: DUF928 domain-containing protein [Nitrospira sp.]|nr:DUF928 domain-containing protein [Nitrospira sp.]